MIVLVMENLENLTSGHLDNENGSSPSNRRDSTSPELVSLSSSGSEETTSNHDTVSLHEEETTDASPSFGQGASVDETNTTDRHTYGRITDTSDSTEQQEHNLTPSQTIPGSSSQPLQMNDTSAKTLVSSPTYRLVDKSKLTVLDYESTGLLYARSTKAAHDLDLLVPADEVAEEVGFMEGAEEEDEGDLHVHPAQIHHVKDLITNQPPLATATNERLIAPIDPGALLEIERSAKCVATDLVHVMDNLRNSLHAMTVCTKQSMELHRESVDNLHAVVDANIKGMYTFMARYEELFRSLTPLKLLAAQIREMDENLKTLESAFAKSQ